MRASSRVARQLLIAVPALIALGGVLVACKEQPTSSGAAAPVAYQDPGAVVYSDACARCHGDYRQGDGTAPALDGVRMASLGDSPLRFTIAYGKGQMPGFGGLSPDQVEALITYLRSV
jgi:mono/diheme cytochrome c family protein